MIWIGRGRFHERSGAADSDALFGRFAHEYRDAGPKCINFPSIRVLFGRYVVNHTLVCMNYWAKLPFFVNSSESRKKTAFFWYLWSILVELVNPLSL